MLTVVTHGFEGNHCSATPLISEIWSPFLIGDSVPFGIATLRIDINPLAPEFPFKF